MVDARLIPRFAHSSFASSSYPSSLRSSPSRANLLNRHSQLRFTSVFVSSSFFATPIHTLVTAMHNSRCIRSATSRRSDRVVVSCRETTVEEFSSIRIHYHRPDWRYDGWECRVWGKSDTESSHTPSVFTNGLDEFGLYWDVRVKVNESFDFVLQKDGLEDCKGSGGGDHEDIWVIANMHVVFKEKPNLTSFMQDHISFARAFWVTRSLIAWNVDIQNGYYYIYTSRDARLQLTSEGIQGYDTRIPVEPLEGSLPSNVTAKFPHIADYKTFKISNIDHVEEILKSQLAFACHDANGSVLNVTALQLPGVIDDLFSYDGPLGAVITKETVKLCLWAPTEQVVQACLYAGAYESDPIETVNLTESAGVWSAEGPIIWEGCYYVYKVKAFHLSSRKIETCIVNDPYARGVSADGQRTLIVNLDSDNLKPIGWDQLAEEKPNLSSFSDISLYELHIRDFSASDITVDPDIRGGYLAFTVQKSAGIKHLKTLSEAGLTHIHLLPSFQFAGVNDDKKNWKHLDEERLAPLPPDSELQQAEVVAIQDEDGYNWGYNPVLWGVPKGSYASDPDGASRTLEFRKMVQALNHIGLRVVLDVVYNHVHESGPYGEGSVFDKVVPEYFLRRDADGRIENSACANNTASEHYMVERLIIDDILCWAIKYKVDGFRFDLMGHIMKSTMLKARSKLNNLSKDNDGVDGSKIYMYGEGWDFGEVYRNSRGVNASQFNMCGTGIGSFNDRIRDAMLGGSPFGPPLQQGFLTGLFLKPNDDPLEPEASEHMLADLKDHIQVGLAANLKNYVFTNLEGKAVKGSEVLVHDGVPVAYALCPTETVNYVSAHDNETLFDAISLKTKMEIPIHERCRINHLGTSLVALSQGIPFFHSGDEMLRSKSLDRDSYNSGDWFNRMKIRLANSSFKPLKSHIISAVENFLDLLKLRYSSPLFRLKTANEIQERVRFHNCGPSWIRGVIMSIEDGHSGMPGMAQLDPLYSYVVVVFNVCPYTVNFSIPALREKRLSLHPVQLMLLLKTLPMKQAVEALSFLQEQLQYLLKQDPFDYVSWAENEQSIREKILCAMKVRSVMPFDIRFGQHIYQFILGLREISMLSFLFQYKKMHYY